MSSTEELNSSQASEKLTTDTHEETQRGYSVPARTYNHRSQDSVIKKLTALSRFSHSMSNLSARSRHALRDAKDENNMKLLEVCFYLHHAGYTM